MIEEQARHVQIIFNEHPHPPKFFTVPKSQLRLFVILFPSLIITLFTLLLGWAVVNSSREHTKASRVSVSPSDSSQQELIRAHQELSDLKKSYLDIQNRLAHSSGQTTTTTWLGLVKPPGTFQDLSAQSPIKLEAVELDTNRTRNILRFNMVNTSTPAEKISGHIFIYQLGPHGLSPYPAMTAREWVEGIGFNKGESFSISRLRPVRATFPSVDDDARFLVLAFSREGDLIFRQELTNPTRRTTP